MSIRSPFHTLEEIPVLSFPSGMQVGKFTFTLDAEWNIISCFPKHAGMIAQRGPLCVISTAIVYGDNRSWLHVSLSCADRLPTYDEMCEVKRVFIGRDKKAIQVFPPESDRVNIHPYCLHLWHCITEDILPDFQLIKGQI